MARAASDSPVKEETGEPLACPDGHRKTSHDPCEVVMRRWPLPPQRKRSAVMARAASDSASLKETVEPLACPTAKGRLTTLAKGVVMLLAAATTALRGAVVARAARDSPVKTAGEPLARPHGQKAPHHPCEGWWQC